MHCLGTCSHGYNYAGRAAILHNTKIASSKANEDKAFKKSRKFHLPHGRTISFFETQQQVLGYPEVMTTLRFIQICTKAFEQRPTTRIKLNENGNVVPPDFENVPDAHSRVPACKRCVNKSSFLSST